MDPYFEKIAEDAFNEELAIIMSKEAGVREMVRGVKLSVAPMKRSLKRSARKARKDPAFVPTNRLEHDLLDRALSGGSMGGY